MRNLILILLMWTGGWSSVSGAAAVTQLPTVSASFFKVGQSWTWDYIRQDGSVYSTETYRVVEVQGPQITLEMSTHFPDNGNFLSHHRLLVNVDRCLRAYRNPSHVQPWNFRMFYRQGQSWTEVKPPTTLAFEEKFNCNPHVHNDREFLTNFRNTFEGPLFQQKRWRTRESSWFESEGPNAGVSREKEFGAGAGSQSFTAHRRP